MANFLLRINSNLMADIPNSLSLSNQKNTFLNIWEASHRINIASKRLNTGHQIVKLRFS